jgi:hypothetical protein
MREHNKFLSLFVAVAFILICGVNANAQGMGGHALHDGYHGMDWPDTLSTITVSGEGVATLVNANQTAGKHAVRWRGIDTAGRSLASGIYWYRLEVAGMAATKKMIMMK